MEMFMKCMALITGSGGVAALVIEEYIGGTALCLTSILSMGTMYLCRELRITRSLAESADVYREENDKFMKQNKNMEGQLEELEESNQGLLRVQTSLREDLEVLRGTVGLIGERGDALLVQLKEVHKKLEMQNNKQSILIKRQMCLHVMQLAQHLDKNCDFILDEGEVQEARRYLKAISPGVDVDVLERMMVDGKLDLVDFVDHVKNVN
tara:strand:- start:1395 stop:2021 length:627 start_codon:yes stop_codon:yes gene_type:complete